MSLFIFGLKRLYKLQKLVVILFIRSSRVLSETAH